LCAHLISALFAPTYVGGYNNYGGGYGGGFYGGKIVQIEKRLRCAAIEIGFCIT